MSSAGLRAATIPESESLSPLPGRRKYSLHPVRQAPAAPPSDAYAAVSYKGRWFWIADADVKSKLIFSGVMLLFSISEVGAKSAAPVVTLIQVSALPNPLLRAASPYSPVNSLPNPPNAPICVNAE